MIRALLMIGDRLVRVDNLRSPPPYVRYHIHSMISPYVAAYTNDSISTSDTSTWAAHDFSRQEIVFHLSRRVGYDVYEYQFEHIESNNTFEFQINDHIEPGEEPAGKVNLERLAKKCKKRKRVKKLLLKYLRSSA